MYHQISYHYDLVVIDSVIFTTIKNNFYTIYKNKLDRNECEEMKHMQ